MNYSLAVFLIEEKVRLVGVIYESDEAKPNQTVHLYKTLDQSIHVDDIVVVPSSTRHEMTICKVKEVDLRPDFESTGEVLWLIGKVYPESIKETMILEERALTKMKDADYERRKAELQKTLGFKADGGEGLAAFREAIVDPDSAEDLGPDDFEDKG